MTPHELAEKIVMQVVELKIGFDSMGTPEIVNSVESLLRAFQEECFKLGVQDEYRRIVKQIEALRDR